MTYTPPPPKNCPNAEAKKAGHAAHEAAFAVGLVSVAMNGDPAAYTAARHALDNAATHLRKALECVNNAHSLIDTLEDAESPPWED